jgi:hypothetical protein
MAKQAELPQKKIKSSKARQEIELHALANLKQLTELNHKTNEYYRSNISIYPSDASSRNP